MSEPYKDYKTCIVCGYRGKGVKEFEDGFFHDESSEGGTSCHERYENAVAVLRPRYGFKAGDGWDKYLEENPDWNPITPNVGKGWIGIVVNLTEALLLQHPDLHVSQMKEKFGGLRYYTNGLSDLGHTLVRWAEAQSYQTCEVCGEQGKVREGGWLKTLCDDHNVSRAALREYLL